ncbi:MAG TPA: SIS domain-containing protein [Woeseiaceae bacterium]|nr:SIS domain-containing protein [Woeseiaceae bacterium]
MQAGRRENGLAEAPRILGATRMFREAAEAADAVERQRGAAAAAIASLAGELQANPRASVVTVARGSSDHAATYAKYLFETRLGVLTSSAAPSVSSVYASGAHFRNVLLLAISQSGRSPDLLAAVTAARKSGALVASMINADDSPLAAVSDHVIPLSAGEELSVAATKSFIASLAAIAQLAARWSGDAALLVEVEHLPERLRQAWELDWSAALDPLRDAQHLYVVGRGLGFGAALEAALKFKEACGLHAEAFSAAELRHGPMAMVRPGFPVLAFAQSDGTREGIAGLLRELAALGADVLATGVSVPGTLELPSLEADPAIQPMLQIQSLYRLVNALAVARGRDPDRPQHLSKVTETL